MRRISNRMKNYGLVLYDKPHISKNYLFNFYVYFAGKKDMQAYDLDEKARDFCDRLNRQK